MRRVGAYQLQAAIAAVHAEASAPEATDWWQITGLYTALYEAHPTPVVLLNRAVAVAMAAGPELGLRLIASDAIAVPLDGYHLLHAARADLLRRLGRAGEAADAYRRALELASNEVERGYLERRLHEVEPGA
jgi:RNA polymerase sigma-70 factor (ECF subfamily)